MTGAASRAPVVVPSGPRPRLARPFATWPTPLNTVKISHPKRNNILNQQQLTEDIRSAVKTALQEDIGSGDITAQLVAEASHAEARVITRESAIICGQAWVNEVFAQLDPTVRVDWMVQDGDKVSENQTLFTLSGPARSLLTGERTALNFLQLLSGTATTCRQAPIQSGFMVLNMPAPGWRWRRCCCASRRPIPPARTSWQS